jgi:hypothetical protein
MVAFQHRSDEQAVSVQIFTVEDFIQVVSGSPHKGPSGKVFFFTRGFPHQKHPRFPASFPWNSVFPGLIPFTLAAVLNAPGQSFQGFFFHGIFLLFAHQESGIYPAVS